MCIQPSIRPTYISYLLRQTDPRGEIANWTQCPNKCLHVVRGQRSWATKRIHIAHGARHRACVLLLFNTYWTIHLFFSYRVYYGVLCKRYFRKPPVLLTIIVSDKTNDKCSFPVLKFNRTANQKCWSNYILSCRGSETFWWREKRKHSPVFVPVVSRKNCGLRCGISESFYSPGTFHKSQRCIPWISVLSD